MPRSPCGPPNTSRGATSRRCARGRGGPLTLDAEVSALRTVVQHDALCVAVRAAVARVRREDVASAFVAALRPRRYAHWSSLVSYAVAATLPEHDFRELSGRRHCAVCGAYARVDVFPSDRFAALRDTGTVGIDSLRYVAYDLTAFAHDEIREPDESDRRFFDFAVARIAALPAGAKTFDAERAVGMMFSSRMDRKLFLGVLGACGILAAPERPGFWPRFVPYEDRAPLDPSPYTYPVAWWRRNSGDSLAALRAFELDAFLTAQTRAAFVRS